ncbi:MAG: hypothetical protein HYX41_04505 [Bdellovibrio sp.]|nr:hypothetical protein [Bdellovibrio sp.]
MNNDWVLRDCISICGFAVFLPCAPLLELHKSGAKVSGLDSADLFIEDSGFAFPAKETRP